MMVTSVTLAKGLHPNITLQVSLVRSFGQLDTLNCKLSWASNLCVSFYFHFPMFFFHFRVFYAVSPFSMEFCMIWAKLL